MPAAAKTPARSNGAKEKQPARSLLVSYVTGFLLSLLLTVTAYVTAVSQTISHGAVIGVIVGLAIAQLLVQLVFFLHLGRGSGSRFNLTVFLFMLLVVGILVIGSLWIMENLNYHMTPHQMEEKMLDQYHKGGI